MQLESSPASIGPIACAVHMQFYFGRHATLCELHWLPTNFMMNPFVMCRFSFGGLEYQKMVQKNANMVSCSVHCATYYTDCNVGVKLTPTLVRGRALVQARTAVAKLLVSCHETSFVKILNY